MTLPRFVVVSIAALSIYAGAALADHNHMTVDTIPSSPQNQILIRAGYYPAESAFSISGGRLLFNGDIAVYDVVDELAQTGPLNGWHAGDELLLTSDFYFATGSLDGGNFMWELASVTALSGGTASLVWGDFDLSGTLTPLADSTAATRLGRSFDTMVAGHDHEQGYAFSTPGLYDVTFIVWDSNGIYGDSEPVKVRFQVHDVPCPADFNNDGGASVQDIFDFLAAYFVGDLHADVNGSEGVTVQDIFDFLNSYFSGCP